MSETKQCPYCGGEILAVAKKCKHCGKWLEQASANETTTGSTTPTIDNKVYKTRELNWWQKCHQVYWFIPKSSLLDEFIYKDGIVSIKNKKGKVFSAPLSEIRMRWQKDQYSRKQISVSHDSNKIYIMEVSYMLTDEEWEEIFTIMDRAGDAKQMTVGKIADAMQKVTGAAKDFIQ